MSKLYIMIGPPGSGKSTIANELTQQSNIMKISLDQIRQELGVHNPKQEKHTNTREIATNRIATLLMYGLDVVYDSTNISTMERKYIIEQVKNKYKQDLEIIAVLVLCSIDECIARDKKREKATGEEKIIEFLEGFSPPQLEEGFTDIKAFLNSQPIQLTDWFNKTQEINFNENSTFKQHCEAVANKINDSTLSLAAKYRCISQVKYTVDAKKSQRGRFGSAGISSYLFMCSDLAKLSFAGGKYTIISDIATIISFYWLPILFNTRESFLKECRNVNIPERLFDGIEELCKYEIQTQ